MIDAIPYTSTGTFSYTAAVALESVTPTFTDGDTEVAVAGDFANAAGDGLTWALTIARTEFTSSTTSKWAKILVSLLCKRLSAEQYVTDEEWAEVQPAGWPAVLCFVADLKDYLAVTGTAKDDEIARLIVSCQRELEQAIGRLFAAAEVTESVSVRKNQTHMRLRNTPLDASADLTILDPDGNTFDADYFTVDYATGILRTLPPNDEPTLLTEGTWSVTYTGGLDQRTDAAAVEYDLAGAVRDLVAVRYQARNPHASSEKDGDVGVVYGSPVTRGGALYPDAIQRVIDRYRVRL